MMFNKSVRFQAPNDSGGSSDGTPAAGSVPAGTPPQGTADAGQQEAQKKFEEMLAKRDQDINNLKSSMQRQMAQQQKQWEQERKRLEDDLVKAQLATLDDDEKKEFQRNMELEQAGHWRQVAQQKEQELQEVQARQSYRDFFVAQGVPVEKLVTDQGLDDLVSSGWQGVQDMMKDMRAKLKEYEDTHMTTVPNPQTPTPNNDQRAPISATSAPAGSGPTWNDLIKQYGSAEEVYRMVEAGEISPSVIPTS